MAVGATALAPNPRSFIVVAEVRAVDVKLFVTVFGTVFLAEVADLAHKEAKKNGVRITRSLFKWKNLTQPLSVVSC